ncbi:MAG: cell division protein FtsL [Proteobacteria bacterium]|nr:cell division protein FtsL [Pseudomonadota bacterium]
MSNRLNLFLLLAVIVSAICVVSAQNKERLAFISLEQQQALTRKIEVKWGQLELEQSTWAVHSRIQAIATEKLHMKLPQSKDIQIVLAGKDGEQNPK